MNPIKFDGNLPGFGHIDRALEVAVAGGYSVTLIGGQARHLYQDYAQRKWGELIVNTDQNCPCGNRFNKRKECFCTPEEVEAHIRKRSTTDISIEVPPLEPADCERAVKKLFPNLTIVKPAMSMLVHAVDELGMDVLDLATTCLIADTIREMVGKEEKINIEHVAEAIQYRQIKY